MTKRQKAGYCGPLAKPIKLTGLRGVFTSKGELERHCSPERLEKLQLLLDHYGICPDDTNCWCKLAYALACRHVPGFRQVTSEHRTGPKRQWWIDDWVKLLRDVERLTERRGMSSRSACFNLVKQDDYKNRDVTGATLYRQYQRAKNIKRRLGPLF